MNIGRTGRVNPGAIKAVGLFIALGCLLLLTYVAVTHEHEIDCESVYIVDKK